MGDLSWHMVEHLVLTTIAAPVLGIALRPWPKAAMPRTEMAAGVAASTAALLLWHHPALFEADGAAHGLQHASFVGTATLLWWAVWRSDSVGKMLALFLASLPPMALGAAMTLAATPWYGAALHDQRVAGALMWGAGSVTGLLAAAAAFALWMSRASPSQGSTSAPCSSASRRSSGAAG